MEVVFQCVLRAKSVKKFPFCLFSFIAKVRKPLKRFCLVNDIFSFQVEGSIGYSHWVCSSLISEKSRESHVILKGKPAATLSHLHPEYRKAVLQSATALSKYTGIAIFLCVEFIEFKSFIFFLPRLWCKGKNSGVWENVRRKLLSYNISQLVSALWLVYLASCISMSNPPNSKVYLNRNLSLSIWTQKYNEYLTDFVFSHRTASYGTFSPSRFIVRQRSAEQ